MSKNDTKINPLFLTLTFRENVTDVTTARIEFKKFVLRFNYTFYERSASDLCYVAVPEFQKRGAVHYHCVLFNVLRDVHSSLDYEKIWGNGFIKINSVNDTEHLTNYVAKYLTKDNLDDRLFSRRHFYSSRNVRRPDIYYGDFIPSALEQQLSEARTIGFGEYSNAWCGSVAFRSYYFRNPVDIQGAFQKFTNKLATFFNIQESDMIESYGIAHPRNNFQFNDLQPDGLRAQPAQLLLSI